MRTIHISMLVIFAALALAVSAHAQTGRQTSGIQRGIEKRKQEIRKARSRVPATQYLVVEIPVDAQAQMVTVHTAEGVDAQVRELEKRIKDLEGEVSARERIFKPESPQLRSLRLRLEALTESTEEDQ